MTQRAIEFPRVAREWLEALPLGNGRLGAMCWGGLPARIDLNEETVWSGHPRREAAQRRRDESDVVRQVAAARTAALEGRPHEAADALRDAQAGHVQAFLPVGSLTIDAGEIVDGRVDRRLSLADAVHTSESGSISSETFVSAPHDVLVHRIVGLDPRAEARVSFESPLREVSRRDVHDGLLRVLQAPVDVAPGHEPQLPAAVWPDVDDESVTTAVCVVSHREADELVVVVAIETTYPGVGEARFTPVPTTVDRALMKARAALSEPYARVRTEHVAAHADLFDRVDLTTTTPPAETTAERLDRARSAVPDVAIADPDIVPLLFAYGRYLLIAASRAPGRLPATLQGIWNADMRPPWSSAYTLNINTEMNYWAAEPTNLSEVVDPLVDLIAAIARTGAITARELGGAGWAVHHNSDAWGHSAAVGEGRGDASWAFWPMAGAWLVRHLAERSAFGTDDTNGEGADLLRGAAEFILSWVIEMPDGRLGTAPSTSPENTYVGPSGEAASVGCTSTMDLALAREMLERAAREPDELGRRARTALDLLPDLADRATSDGVREWDREVTDVDPHHRHLSHLYPLFPGDGADEAFERAAAITLDRRGADSTGWSLAWKIALWARLRGAERIDELIELFLRDADAQHGQWAGGLYPNLFAAHPPFQIDGNLGFTAGIAEALLQSHRREIELLPALPSALKSGTVRGLVARPGVVVDIRWADRELISATFTARPGRDGSVTVRWRERTIDIEVSSAEPITLTPASMSGDASTAAGER